MDIPSGKIEALAPGMAGVLGLPLDVNSSFLRGAASAPGAIRQVLRSGSGNWCCENELDFSTNKRWADTGDLELTGLSGAAAFEAITTAVGRMLEAGGCPLLLGGDHSITYPVVRAFARRYPELNILHLDAHPDLYDSLDGNRYSHASPFACIMEEGLVCRLVQVGIRTSTTHQCIQVERFGVETIELRSCSPNRTFTFDGLLYLSLDLDVFDPAFAPGVSHHEPGGFSTREVLHLLQGLNCDLVGADIVEVNPSRDAAGITAALAAELYKELIVKLLDHI